MEVRFCDETDFGFGWIASEPKFMERCSHALADGGRVWLTDPVDGDGVEERARALGEPAGVIQLLDRHERDGPELAGRLGIPLVKVPRARLEGTPFDIIPLGRRESALWWPERRVLVCADAVGTAGYFRAPGERLALHPFRRLKPPRRLGEVFPEHILCGHGEGVHEGADEALHEALRTGRRWIPRWLVGLARR